MKKQIVVIHGADAFDTYEQYLSFLRDVEIDFERFKSSRKDWKGTLEGELGQDFEVILPNMPNKTNARYLEWKIWFEKLVPFLEDTVVLIGHSMGATFLVKYLSENTFPKKILATFLVAGPYDDKDSEESLVDFALSENLEKLIQQGGKIYLYHSKDDPVVPFADFGKYKKVLFKAEAKTFDDRGHFNQSKFPELVEDIKRLY
ncbi:alpha/beta hydrolase [Patescibacteria group bacterium]|nr:alpha/beta hydrolase [Patescibacteria group bacterium]